MLIQITILILKTMFRSYIKIENGKIWEVIEQDSAGKHKNINYIADYIEPEEKPKKTKKGEV